MERLCLKQPFPEYSHEPVHFMNGVAVSMNSCVMEKQMRKLLGLC